VPSVALNYTTGEVVRVQDLTGPFTGDPDWVTAQDADAAISAGTAAVPQSSGAVAVAVTIEAYDADGEAVAGDRGMWTVTPVRVVRGVVHDGVSWTAPSWRRVVVDDASGGSTDLGFRITNPSIPAGATELRVFVEALRGS